MMLDGGRAGSRCGCGMGQFVPSPYDVTQIRTGTPLQNQILRPDPISSNIADLYESVQYGAIPRLATGDAGGAKSNVPLPVPGAPQTALEMSGDPRLWTPEMAAKLGQENYQNAIAAYIAAQEVSGSYTPEGSLPFTAEWLSQYKWWLIGGAALVAGFFVFGRR